MRCDNCGKEESFVEIIGKDMVCKKCVQKHKIMGNLFRTHINTFHYVLRHTKPASYEEFMNIDRKTLEKLVDFAKIGVKIKTTNVVELE